MMRVSAILNEHILSGVMDGKGRSHKAHGDLWPRNRVICYPDTRK